MKHLYDITSVNSRSLVVSFKGGLRLHPLRLPKYEHVNNIRSVLPFDLCFDLYLKCKNHQRVGGSLIKIKSCFDLSAEVTATKIQLHQDRKFNARIRDTCRNELCAYCKALYLMSEQATEPLA